MIENFSKGILGEEAYPSPACARKRVCRAKEEEDLKIDACYNVLALITPYTWDKTTLMYPYFIRSLFCSLLSNRLLLQLPKRCCRKM
jgi:hypothetical protein